MPGLHVCYSTLSFVSFISLLQNVIDFLNIQMCLPYHCHFCDREKCFWLYCSFWGVSRTYQKCTAGCSGRYYIDLTIYFLHKGDILDVALIFFVLSSISALAPGSLFGLATFSHKLGLYDVQGPIPVVKNVFIPPDAEETLPIELEDVMPLLQFLAPVCSS